jgi:hypothetical protein
MIASAKKKDAGKKADIFVLTAYWYSLYHDTHMRAKYIISYCHSTL